MRKSFWTIFLVLAFLASFTGFEKPVQAATEAVFTVSGVNVDVTAASAAAARNTAFSKAQAQAFDILVKRILSETELAYFQMPEAEIVSALVKDYEITEEKLSPVRYIGTYTFRFKDDAVRDYFAGTGLHYTDVSSKPVLVLPFYQAETKTILWGTTNPWLTAWSNADSYQGLVPFVVPIGDLQDVSDINDNGLAGFDPEAIKNMVARYGAGEAVMLTAIPQWTGQGNGNENTPDYLDLHVYSTAGDYPRLIDTMKVITEAGDTAESLYARAVKTVKDSFQRQWKNRTVIAPNQDNSLKARVRFASMAEWIETQKALRKVQGISNVSLLSLSPNEASLELEFNGTAQRLRLALAQADMTLTTPSLSFDNPYLNNPYSNAYNGYNAGLTSSPLVYDLYLNKYRR